MDDVNKAMRVLELSEVPLSEISTEVVRRQYRKMALKIHPDKNDNTPESVTRFQALHSAYELMLKMVDSSEDVPVSGQSDHSDQPTFFSTEDSYFDILKQFMKSAYQGTYNDDIGEKIRYIVMNKCQDVSTGLFENMDRDTSLTVYQFLCNNKKLLHVGDEVLESVKSVIEQKFDGLEIYVIEPTVSDLLSDSVYKLVIDDEQFLVPLWHREMYFDMKNGKELLVMCRPVLPVGYDIDDNNNLTVRCSVPFTMDLLEEEGVCVGVDVDAACPYTLVLPTKLLTFSRVQLVRLRKRGILQINESTIYNHVEERGDLHVVVTFV
jgi:hypothetical protein